MRRLAQWKWPAGFAVVQFPNPPLLVALAAGLGGRASSGSGHRLFVSLFYVALSVWAYEEARHGENWFRRLLGLGFCVYVVIDLAHTLRT